MLEHRADPRVVGIDLSRTFGHYKAIMTRLEYARGCSPRPRHTRQPDSARLPSACLTGYLPMLQNTGRYTLALQLLQSILMSPAPGSHAGR